MTAVTYERLAELPVVIEEDTHSTVSLAVSRAAFGGSPPCLASPEPATAALART